ncbi:hypothetical protein OF83DRAFT_378408 [Amylostereum chailletii]|nr:hypothetical protein OF83DRAFT_378408 [Amylostereum chailletii]
MHLHDELPKSNGSQGDVCWVERLKRTSVPTGEIQSKFMLHCSLVFLAVGSASAVGVFRYPHVSVGICMYLSTVGNAAIADYRQRRGGRSWNSDGRAYQGLFYPVRSIKQEEHTMIILRREPVAYANVQRSEAFKCPLREPWSEMSAMYPFRY